MAKKYHPDTNPDPNSQKHFLKIKEAFEILKHPARRAEWDRDSRLNVDDDLSAAMDPTVVTSFYRNRAKMGAYQEYYGANDTVGPESPSEAKEREKKFKKNTAITFLGCFLLYVAFWETGTRVSRNRESRLMKRAPSSKEPGMRIEDVKDAETARKYNEARLPKRKFVVRENVEVTEADVA